MGALGIALATIAVMLMSLVKTDRPLPAFLLGWTDPTALLGLVAGGFFGIAAVGVRAASVSLRDPGPFVAAAVTLVIATSIQTAVMAGYLATRERGQIGRAFAHARAALLVGSRVGHRLGGLVHRLLAADRRLAPAQEQVPVLGLHVHVVGWRV